jgi:hypothetical protein
MTGGTACGKYEVPAPPHTRHLRRPSRFLSDGGLRSLRERSHLERGLDDCALRIDVDAERTPVGTVAHRFRELRAGVVQPDARFGSYTARKTLVPDQPVVRRAPQLLVVPVRTRAAG